MMVKDEKLTFDVVISFNSAAKSAAFFLGSCLGYSSGIFPSFFVYSGGFGIVGDWSGGWLGSFFG
jgi:hypothetical protein